MAAKYAANVSIKIAQQEGKGKGDAVRKGFALTSNDILMILDADLTVPPEDLAKFYQAIVSGKGAFINGSRLVDPMEAKAMRGWNLLGNKIFASLFFVLGNGSKTHYAHKSFERAIT
jgi:glycosyltransferase involved in cell wall biosynthesis